MSKKESMMNESNGKPKTSFYASLSLAALLSLSSCPHTANATLRCGEWLLWR